jgi:hypothetical protein
VKNPLYFSLIIVLCLTNITIFCLTMPGSPVRSASYSGGDGSAENPYQIATIADWNNLTISSADWNSNFVLTADLDFGGAAVDIIGNHFTAFSGSFNGNGHKLSNGTVSGTTYTGVFGSINSPGFVTDLNIENFGVTASNKNPGVPE